MNNLNWLLHFSNNCLSTMLANNERYNEGSDGRETIDTCILIHNLNRMQNRHKNKFASVIMTSLPRFDWSNPNFEFETNFKFVMKNIRIS